jgi:hypothetical protein
MTADALAAPEIVARPDAPAGASDPTRRWALRMGDGLERFPGLTRGEAAAAGPSLQALGPDGWDHGLAEIVLPVVLSEGAGPYLLDADGRITLVLGPHPAIAQAHVAMGHPGPGHRIGLVARADAAWRWLVRAEVEPAGRVAALDALDACPGLPDARRWAAGHR